MSLKKMMRKARRRTDMAKILRVDELLAVMHNINHPLATALCEIEKTVAALAAKAIADELGVDASEPEYEMDLGGWGVVFSAKAVGQPCPDALYDFDMTEWTGPDGEYLNPETGAPL
jgi:hypothetical protein